MDDRRGGEGKGEGQEREGGGAVRMCVGSYVVLIGWRVGGLCGLILTLSGPLVYNVVRYVFYRLETFVTSF